MSYIKNRKCSIDGCNKRHDSHGYCGMHSQRFRRYGNPNHITSEEDRVKLNRMAQPRLGKAKPHVYPKFFGRHMHRAIMEEYLGRKLNRNEIVHHKDGNKHNKHIDNLQLMTQSEHIKLHLGEEKKLRK